MEILGIGIPELVFILLIAIVILGPKDMQKAGKTIGTWLNKIALSSTWKDIRGASRRISTLPNELMREANLEEFLSEEALSGESEKHGKRRQPKGDYGAWSSGEAPHQENSIAPPIDDEPASAKDTDGSPEENPDNAASTEENNA
jgi:sec-independent protein translocase protein TatB